MPRPPRRQGADAIICALAAQQHGVVIRGQLRLRGLTDDMVNERIARGVLVRIHRGVYRVGPIASSLVREMAACLACGPHAWISHATATVLWKFLAASSGDVDIVVKCGYHRIPGIRVHRIRDIRSDEVTQLDGIPITRPARTLLDLAATAPHREVEQAFAQAVALRLTTQSQLREMLNRYPRRRGVRVLRDLLDSRPALTRSEAEELFLGRVRRSRLPEPESNVRVAGFEVDFLWREQRLIAEIDGFAFHAAPDAFEKDRHRDLVLTSRGMRVVRITWQQLAHDLDAVIVRLAQALTWGR